MLDERDLGIVAGTCLLRSSYEIVPQSPNSDVAVMVNYTLSDDS